jgi:hypothetical protein
MAKEPVVLASPLAHGSRFQTETVAGRLVVATLGDKITAAGVAAVLAVLSTYYSSTINAAQLAALKSVTGDGYVVVSACDVIASVAPGTEAALAALLVTALKTNGNTVAG